MKNRRPYVYTAQYMYWSWSQITALNLSPYKSRDKIEHYYININGP